VALYQWVRGGFVSGRVKFDLYNLVYIGLHLVYILGPEGPFILGGGLHGVHVG